MRRVCIGSVESGWRVRDCVRVPAHQYSHISQRKLIPLTLGLSPACCAPAELRRLRDLFFANSAAIRGAFSARLTTGRISWALTMNVKGI
jgi:hypothetical protein